MSINNVIVSRNLGKAGSQADRHGTDVATFSMCVNDRRKNQQTAEWEERA